ncbi:mucin-5AC [Aedes aegypti]|uniref:Uncharacterized protein n=1 Tax=Aedes aegypti TaxID=7159 RepID=A0A1S4EY58_AEDAE|nr:mucin-5AC [Aedes aegypti]
MENGKAICWLLFGLSLVFLVNSGDVSSSGNSPNKGGELNATVSQVIQALGDSPYHGDSSQEHSKRGRIFARKGVDMNVTTTTTTTTSAPTVAIAPKASEAQQLNNVTTAASKSQQPPPPLPQVNISNPAEVGSAAVNLTTVAKSNATLPTPASNATSSVNLPAVGSNSASNVTATSTTSTTTSTTTTSTTTTSTTTTTTTTTTTKPPKKPKITYSVDDEPKLLQAAKPGYNAGSSVSDANGHLHVEEPLAELSKEYIPPALMGPPRGHREYVVPVVTLIFAIPLLMGLFLLSYRRAKEFWLTRHYRRMDFLVDGMYNY